MFGVKELVKFTLGFEIALMAFNFLVFTFTKYKYKLLIGVFQILGDI